MNQMDSVAFTDADAPTISSIATPDDSTIETVHRHDFNEFDGTTTCSFLHQF